LYLVCSNASARCESGALLIIFFGYPFTHKLCISQILRPLAEQATNMSLASIWQAIERLLNPPDPPNRIRFGHGCYIDVTRNGANLFLVEGHVRLSRAEFRQFIDALAATTEDCAPRSMHIQDASSKAWLRSKIKLDVEISRKTAYVTIDSCGQGVWIPRSAVQESLKHLEGKVL
jgi:hypothetical protein